MDRRVRFALALSLSLVAMGAAFLAWRAPAVTPLVDAFTGRGCVAWARQAAPPGPLSEAPGVDLRAVAAGSEIAKALDGGSPAALISALDASGCSHVAVDAGAGAEVDAGDALRLRLGAYMHVPGLRGLFVAPELSLYTVDPLQSLSPRLQLAIATVARGMLEGRAAPEVGSFPLPLRRVQHVEVMVLLRAGPRPRLWRSARGSSVGQALITATRVARQRWAERREAMGAPLHEVLPNLTVDVALLVDDGRLSQRDVAFVDRVFTPEHGVAFERKGAWRYLLPAATREAGGGRASVAYRKLLADEGLQPGALSSPDLQPYRLAVQVVATSAPETDTAAR